MGADLCKLLYQIDYLAAMASPGSDTPREIAAALIDAAAAKYDLDTQALSDYVNLVFSR